MSIGSAQWLFGGVEPLGPAVVVDVGIEAPRPDREVEGRHGLLEPLGIELEQACEGAQILRRERRVDRGHEARQRLGVDDHIADLVRLLRDQPAPDRVALGPEVLALVVEALGVRG